MIAHYLRCRACACVCACTGAQEPGPGRGEGGEGPPRAKMYYPSRLPEQKKPRPSGRLYILCIKVL